MTYCTLQDLVDRYGQTKLVQLTDKTNRPQSTVDAVVVDRAITDASSLVSSYLGKKYQLPLSVEAPEVLTTYAVQIAWFLLHGESAGKDSPVRMAYADALAWLGKVATGLVVIDGAGAITPAGGGQIKTSRPNRVFTRDSMGEF